MSLIPESGRFDSLFEARRFFSATGGIRLPRLPDPLDTATPRCGGTDATTDSYLLDCNGRAVRLRPLRPLTTGAPPDKRKIGEHARSQVAHARNILLQYERLATVPERLRKAVRDQVAERLAKMPLAELKKVAKGLRLVKLDQAGIATVADIRGNSHHRLLQIPGVGAQTVEEAKAAAEKIAERVSADARPRLTRLARIPATPGPWRP